MSGIFKYKYNFMGKTQEGVIRTVFQGTELKYI